METCELKVKFFDIFSTNFAVRNLQLNAPLPNFFNPWRARHHSRMHHRYYKYCTATAMYNINWCIKDINKIPQI